MISYAYRSKRREEESIVYANDCTSADAGVRLYCPNDDCDAHMFLCNLENPEIKPYFRATQKNHSHIEGCRYAKLNFQQEDYNEPEFDFLRATHNVMKPSKTGQPQTEKSVVQKSRKLPPHTIKQIYELAISNKIDFCYNDTKMWQLLADKRSAHIYRKGLFHSCLVEAVFAGFKVENKFIRMKYFTDISSFHYLKLYFNEENVFSEAVKMILDAKPSPIIVWGEWKSVDYYFKTIVYSVNQLYVP